MADQVRVTQRGVQNVSVVGFLCDCLTRLS